MKSRSRASAPTTVKRTVARGRLPNAEHRTREYLTEREVERLMKAAGNNRHGHRDATMIFIAFRHGLRASELCSLRWEQVDLFHFRCWQTCKKRLGYITSQHQVRSNGRAGCAHFSDQARCKRPARRSRVDSNGPV